MNRRAVRINQLGYLPGAPKQATLVTDTTTPLDLTVTAGEAVWRGRSQPWSQRPEPTSGLAVHVLDFTAADVRGDHVRLTVGAADSHPFRVVPDLYRGLADDALRFFRLMRSGDAITEPGYTRQAGHRGDAAVAAWTGSDAERLYSGWHPTGTFDVSGGWYDAGDYGKYVVSGSLPVWQLLGIRRRATNAGGSWTGCCGCLCRRASRWRAWRSTGCTAPSGRRSRACRTRTRPRGCCTGPRPPRPCTWPPSPPRARGRSPRWTRVRGAATGGAHGPRGRARPSAADRPDDEGRFGGGPYGDDRLDDDFYWAAAELWLTTGEQAFLDEPTASREHTADVFDPAGFDFDRVAAPARIDLALVPSALPDRGRVRASVVAAGEHLLALQAAQPWGQPYAPAAGWDWGSNGRILNNLVVLVAAHAITDERRFRDGVAVGMDYLLGRNALGQSYVTGYGTTPPGTCAPGSSPTTRRPGRWRAGRTRASTPDGRPTPASSGGRRSAATSTSPRRRPRTTCASAGTRRSPSSPTR